MTPITELTVETAARALWQEWLASWFDGAAHVVGTNAPVVFPKVTFGFDQSPITQPLADAPVAAPGTVPVEIRVTIDPVRDELCHIPGGKLATTRVVTNFWIRCRSQDPALDRRRALEVAQLLKAILTNPSARVELARYGVAHLNPRPPGLVADRYYVLYLISCPGELSYEIKF